MDPVSPSRTALGAAAHRAAHQILEHGSIFADPLAVLIAGVDVDRLARIDEGNPSARRMRHFIAMRTRFAEDALAAAVESGTRQLVILGAGLDTYAYRTPFADRLRIFEVDHPATQAWKRQRLEAISLAIPACLTFAPIDFEQQSLAEGLGTAGFDPAQETFFTWLGVLPYLTEEAIWRTLEYIGGLAGGARVVFDYGNPPQSLSPELRASHDVRAARVASLGEAFRTYFEAESLHPKLLSLGFNFVEDLGPHQLRERYLPSAPAKGGDKGGHVLLASSTRR